MARHLCRGGAAAYIERTGPRGEPLALPIYPLEMVWKISADLAAGMQTPNCPCCGRTLARESRRRARIAGDPIVFRCLPCGRSTILRPIPV